MHNIKDILWRIQLCGVACSSVGISAILRFVCHIISALVYRSMFRLLISRRFDYV